MSQKSEQILQSKTTIYQIRFSDHKAMKDGVTMVKDTDYGRIMSRAKILNGQNPHFQIPNPSSFKMYEKLNGNSWTRDS